MSEPRTKVVNGVRILLTEAEKIAIQAEWDAEDLASASREVPKTIEERLAELENQIKTLIL